MEQKIKLRQTILEERQHFQREQFALQDQKICSIIHEFLQKEFPSFNDIATYLPLPGEPSLVGLYKVLQANYLGPKISDGQLVFVDLSLEELENNGEVHKLVQPKSHKKTEPQVILIPALAYSLEGFRLGFGKGYYDRYLGRNDKKITSAIGICYYSYLYQYLPHESHDQKVDYIITERGIIKL